MVLERGLVVCNGKGGVGKSSTATGLAASAASVGWRTLIVDLDPQGAVGQDLGFRQAGRSDNGQALYRAMIEGAPLEPLRDVRPDLDAIAAGAYTDELFIVMSELYRRDGMAALTRLHDSIAPLSVDHDLIVFDTPPTNSPIVDSALAASRYLLIPSGFDAGSIEGLSRISDRYVDVKFTLGINPELEVLGVVMFGFSPREVRIMSDTRSELQEALADDAPVLESVVRDARKAAKHMRQHGVIASEYLRAAQAAPAWFEADPGAETFARNANGLAEDYWELTREVLEHIVTSLADRARRGAA